jgi:small subunit ribosomal protein S2
MTLKTDFTIKNLLDHGVHFGHKKNLWHPKMSKYIYGIKDNVHVINLKETALLLYKALNVVFKVVSQKGKVLFINTKHQSSETIKNEALRCKQFFINNRWLGGTLTNWETISSSIKTLEYYEQLCKNNTGKYTKKEILKYNRKREKLDRDIGGIRHMNGLPDLLFIMDVKLHSIAVQEAIKKCIPIIAVVDTNSSPDGIDFIIPGNDDSRKSIKLYCSLFADAIIQGSNLANAIEDKMHYSHNKINKLKSDD